MSEHNSPFDDSDAILARRLGIGRRKKGEIEHRTVGVRVWMFEFRNGFALG